jgi:hypothetical protein
MRLPHFRFSYLKPCMHFSPRSRVRVPSISSSLWRAHMVKNSLWSCSLSSQSSCYFFPLRSIFLASCSETSSCIYTVAFLLVYDTVYHPNYMASQSKRPQYESSLLRKHQTLYSINLRYFLRVKRHVSHHIKWSKFSFHILIQHFF